MAIMGIVKHVRRGVVAAAAVIIAGIWFSASAKAGVDSGTAVGIGLGSFALGTALGAASHPYYGSPETLSATATIYWQNHAWRTRRKPSRSDLTL